MTEAARKILCMVSASAKVARPHLERLRAKHPAAGFTFYVRSTERAALEDLLDGHEVRADKPDYRGHGRGRIALIHQLRAQRFDAAVALGLGDWSYWPQKLAFLLARSQKKRVITERGSFAVSLGRPWSLLAHVWWRHKNPVGSIAGMPAGMPLPLLAALYRRTLGLLVGAVLVLAEYGLRRLVRR